VADRWRTGLGLAPVAVALWLGCSAEAPVPAPVVRKPVAPLPAAGASSENADALSLAALSYDPTDRRDPFRSFVRGPELDDGPTGPLERFDLSQLNLSAIIWGIGAPRALIVDPSGKGYIVETGAVMGKNKGRVVSIGDNLVVVKETYVDSVDRATTKPVEMRLRNTEGG